MISRQWQGRVNRAQGAYFEKLIECSLAQYAKDGKAQITKTPEPMKVIRRLTGGRFEACFEKKAEPDYKGCMAPRGREVIFDAKFTTGDKIEQSRITEAQAEVLEAHFKAGAICFVVVGFEKDGWIEVYRIDWLTWQKMADVFGRKHIKLGDLEDMWRKLGSVPGGESGIRHIPLVCGVPMVLDGLD